MKKSKVSGKPLGEYVKRSTYQKVCEENKKLLRDIELMTTDDEDRWMDSVNLQIEWQEKFKKDKKFNEQFKELLKQMIPKK